MGFIYRLKSKYSRTCAENLSPNILAQAPLWVHVVHSGLLAPTIRYRMYTKLLYIVPLWLEQKNYDQPSCIDSESLEAETEWMWRFSATFK